MKTLTTILALILSLTASAQSGTYKLTKSLDTHTMNWMYPEDEILVTINYQTPTVIEYAIMQNGVIEYSDTCSITGSNPYWIKTDFVEYFGYKTRLFKWQDSLTTFTQLYNTDIHYWKRVNSRYMPPLQDKNAGIEEPVISAKVYPNPATDYIEMPFDAEIIGLSGQIILIVRAGRVDISHLPNGIYFAKSLDNSLLISKFVKQ